MKWSQRLVFISVCHSASLSHRLSLSNLFLSQSAFLLSGSELGTVEGPPDISRLYRNEDQTCGSRVQQEEEVTAAQRQEQKRKSPKEIGGHLSKPQQPSRVMFSCHHARSGYICSHWYSWRISPCAPWITCLRPVCIPACVSTLGQCVQKGSYAIVTYYLFVYNKLSQKYLVLGWLWWSSR